MSLYACMCDDVSLCERAVLLVVERSRYWLVRQTNLGDANCAPSIVVVQQRASLVLEPVCV